MSEFDASDEKAVLQRLRSQADAERLRITRHAHQEMVEEAIRVDEVVQAIGTGHILENYPHHRRGPCCLLGGSTRDGRPLHVVCTTANPVLILVTVYEPKPPRWLSPTQRRG